MCASEVRDAVAELDGRVCTVCEYAVLVHWLCLAGVGEFEVEGAAAGNLQSSRPRFAQKRNLSAEALEFSNPSASYALVVAPQRCISRSQSPELSRERSTVDGQAIFSTSAESAVQLPRSQLFSGGVIADACRIALTLLPAHTTALLATVSCWLGQALPPPWRCAKSALSSTSEPSPSLSALPTQDAACSRRP